MSIRRTLPFAIGVSLIGFLFWITQKPEVIDLTAAQLPSATLPSAPADVVPLRPAPAPPSASLVQEQGDAMGAFDLWLRRWQATPAAARAGMIEEGTRLAERREAALYQLIAKEPEAALKAAISPAVRRFLPKAVQPWIEQRIHQRGDLAVVGVTPLRGMEHLVVRPVFREARFEGKTLDAYVYGRRAQQDTKYGSSLLGIAVKDRMAVLDEPAVVMEASDVPEAAKITQGMALGEHVAPPTGSRDKPVLAVQGEYYPVCCAAHAAMPQGASH